MTETKESDRIREQLRYWPYMIHQVDETLDLSMIEGRGRQILFQALNAQNITAFVGSGMSASYGRLSWPAWKAEQLAIVQQNYNAFVEVADAAIEVLRYMQDAVAPDQANAGKAREHVQALYDELHNGAAKEGLQKLRHNCWQWFKFRRREIQNALDQVKHLHSTFERVRKTNDGFPGGDGIPVVFEIAQQLQDELRRHVPFFIDEVAIREAEKLEPNPMSLWPGSFIATKSSAPASSLDVLAKKVEGVIDTKFNSLFKNRRALPKTPSKTLKGALRRYFVKVKSYYHAYSRPEASFTFETLAKVLLVDECAHALLTLRKGYASDVAPEKLIKDEPLAQMERELKVFDDSTLRREVEGIRENPDRYQVLAPFLLDHFVPDPKSNEQQDPTLQLDGLKKNGRNELIAGALEYVETKLTDYRKNAGLAGDDRRFLTPSSRFLLAMCLALHERDARSDLVIKCTDSEGKEAPGRLFTTTVGKSDFTSRRSILADRFDPLNKVVDDLGIRRFITLNYDCEIERYFVDAGFRNFPPKSFMETETSDPGEEEYRVDGVGRVLFDQAFQREKASDMVRFAMGQGNESAAVFHLHGRATLDERLVITERDYMNLYLLEDQHRETVHEGITMAFSSAPLLFLGLGMSETDLLRPLRQFMSNEDRTSGYSSVALLPAEHMLEDRTKYAAALYLRYGVHTIFYGCRP